MSNLGQYLTDHANAGNCAAAYYNGTHQPSCPLSPGVCSVIAYLVVELKNAEYQAATAAANSPVPAYVPPLSPVPFSPVPPVSTGNDGSHYVPGGGGTGTGGTVQVPWGNDGSTNVETR